MTEGIERLEPREAAARLWAERYPSARVLFCGGSVVRGEGLPSSDLDVVVLFDHVPNAWRESFRFAGWPVEVFGHDPETLGYFVAEDCKHGRPSLAQMVAEAFVVPAVSPVSEAVQSWARSVVASVPETPSPASLDKDRYFITDLLDDFRDDRTAGELRAVACKLHPLVYNFVLKTRGQWLGSGKTLPRLVERTAPELSEPLERAFEVFFRTGDRTSVLRVVREILEPFGGELFDGYRSDAPSSCRLGTSEIASLGASVRLPGGE